MSLDRPITSEDVERKQLFRARAAGRTALVVAWDEDIHGWIVEGTNNRYSVNRYGAVYGWQDDDRDLISRIPQEPDMESQVVVEDRRTNSDLDFVSFQDLPANSLFRVSGDNGKPYVYWKLPIPQQSICAIGFNTDKPDHPISYFNANEWTCIPLPKLRLRLVLEDRP